MADNGNLYSICADCGKLIRLNKFLLGSLHLCAEDKKWSVPSERPKA